MNFEKAATYASEFEKPDEARQLLQLATILNYSGQKPYTLESYKGSNERISIIWLLSQGYYSLHYKPYSTEAFAFFLQALNFAKLNELVELKKHALLGIMIVYNYEIVQSNEDKLMYLKEFESLITTASDEFHYQRNLLNFHLTDVFYQIKLDDKAKNNFDDVMLNFEKDHNFWPIYYSLSGVLNEFLGYTTAAVSYHEKAIKLSRDMLYFKHIKFRSLIRLSEISKKSNKHADALKFIKKATEYINLSDTLRGSFYLNRYASYNYAGLGDYQQAYEKIRLSQEQSAQLEYYKNSIEISNLKIKYETAEKEKQLLEQKILLKSEQQQKKNLFISAVSVIVGFTFIVILIYKNTKRKQLLAEQDKRLQEQMVANLLKEQELTTIDAMIAGQEKERQLIANDLHDDLGSLMATVKLHFNALQDKNKGDGAHYEKTNGLLNEAYDKIRAIAHAKNSGVIAKQGLLKAVHNIAEKVSAANSIQIHVVDHGLENRLENSLELSLFRIIQELITNIIKHAQATEAHIHLTNHDETLNIMIEDNGIGFEPKGISAAVGMGIKSIDKRVAHLNGTMTIESEHTKGTTIILDIPV